jgi:RNA polymerase sigma factor (TIGR02999 family)
MRDVTQILNAIEQGDPNAAEDLLPLVYNELRKLAAERLAREKPGQTLDPTALVHEAYLRLTDAGGTSGAPDKHWNGRGHFFAAAAEAMRRILIERARAKGRAKRGGAWRSIDLEHLNPATSVTPDQLLTLDEAIDKLATQDPVAARLVNSRYYAGLSLKEAAMALGIATSTAYRHWAYGRAWLRCFLAEDAD